MQDHGSDHLRYEGPAQLVGLLVALSPEIAAHLLIPFLDVAELDVVVELTVSLAAG
jgi:hypothetical protein